MLLRTRMLFTSLAPLLALVAAFVLLRRQRFVLYTTLTLYAIGLCAGLAASFIGAGADALILPALLYTRLFSPRSAVATSMAVFLLPVQAVTVVKAWRSGDLEVVRVLAIGIAFASGNFCTASIFTASGHTVRIATAIALVVTASLILFAPSEYDEVALRATSHAADGDGEHLEEFGGTDAGGALSRLDMTVHFHNV